MNQTKKINRWKIAFWICFVFLLLTGAVGSYGIIDQAVTLTYLRESYDDTEADLETITELINQTDLTKEEIKEYLQNHRLREYMDFETDSIYLERIQLNFSNDRLGQIKMN